MCIGLNLGQQQKYEYRARNLTHDRPSHHVDCGMVSWLVVNHGKNHLTNMVESPHILVVVEVDSILVVVDSLDSLVVDCSLVVEDSHLVAAGKANLIYECQ